MTMLQCHRAGLVATLSLILLTPLWVFSADLPPPAQPPASQAASPSPEEPTSPEALKKTFRSLMNEDKAASALELAEKVLKSNPDNPDWLFMKSQALTRTNRIDEAMVVLKNLTESAPEMPAPYNNLAALHAARGELDDALRLVQMALLVNPGYALGYENLGDIYLALAQQAWNKSLKINPNDKALKAKIERLGQEKP
jgi:tetratricopeptide (TPR) repeat protein